MIIQSIKFRKTSSSKWESGITIECEGTMNGTIIDKKGDLIDRGGLVYEVINLSSYLTLDLEPILKSIDEDVN